MPYRYISANDIMMWHDPRVLVQLTNDDDRVDYDNPGNINDLLLQMHENQASQTVDNYLRYIYDVPLIVGDTLTPEIIKMIANLTWCSLWERRGEEPDQVTQLRVRIFERLHALTDMDARETRGARQTDTYATRSTKGKARTIFDQSGYFDGLTFPGTRVLAGDRENAQNRGLN